MKFSIKAFLSLFLIIGTVANAADTASILPPAKTTFVDQNGKPLTSGTVDFYIPSTTTRKATWQDAGETILNTNPVVLDAAGRALILGSGSYRQVVKDRLGNVVWDQVTSSVGSGGTSTTGTGDGDLVGTIKPWAGMSAPNQYMFTYGQELSRTTFATLFTAITSSQAIFCTSGSPVLSGLTDTTNFNEGVPVELSCVTGGFTTVIAKTSTTVTLAVNSNLTLNTTAVFFPWGNGNHSSTFNIPDIRGVAPIGNNNMGGVATALINSTYFGTNPNSIGAIGGLQATILTNSNVPSFTSSGTITNGSITSIFTGLSGQTGLTGTGGSQAYTTGGFASSQIVGTVASTQAASTFAGNNNGGSSAPFSRIQPSVTTNYIIKVTPDTNSATASGVTSLGGMTGSIACGTGLLCTGNIISSSFSNPVTGPSTSVVGNLAIFNNTTGNLLAATPTYQSGNIGNAAVISGVPNRTIGLAPTYNGLYFYQGDQFPAILQGGQNLAGLQQTLVVSNTIAAGDSKAGIAIAGYSASNCADPCNTIAIFGQSQGNVAGASIFTTNLLAQNIADNNALGLNVNYLTPAELGPNLWLTSLGTNPTVNGNHFYGLNIQGGGNHTNEIGSAIVINNSAFPATTRWATGLELVSGCCITGVSIGQLALGSNQPSQALQFLTKDAGGTAHIAQIFADANAALYLIPSSSAPVLLEDGLGNVLGLFQAISSIGGNTGFQLNQVSSIGVLKTSATGVVSSSLTLPSSLIAPALTVTGSFTATGLVTNADLVNASTTVNGQTCTLGSTCTITASATSMTVGSTTVLSGTTTRVLFDNAGVLGEYVISGTGNVAMTTNGVFTTPNLGTPSAVVLTNGTGLPTTALTGTLQGAQEPAHTGDVTNSAGSLALAIGATKVTSAMLNADVFSTAHTWAGQQTFVAPILGTPASGVATNLTGTASGLTAGNVTTNANLTGDVTSVGNATTLTNAPVIAKVLTGFTSGAGTVTTSDSILTAFQKINGNDALKAPLASPTFTGTVIIPTLAATTINAFTLAGTIAGGGNQLNNIIIGSSTPLAGSFTTVSASTSATSPLFIGGSTASSTLTLESTSGAGTTDAIIGLTGSQVERFRVTTAGFFNIGPNVAPDAQLTVNANTGATVAPGSGPLLHLIGADSTVARWISDGFAAPNVFLPRYADGTRAAKNAAGAGTLTFAFANSTWDGSSYNVNAEIDFYTTNTQSVSDHSSRILFSVTPTGSTAQAVAMSIFSSGGVGVGAAVTDPGIGKISAINGFVANGTAGITRTCTIAVGNVLTFTLGILTATSGVAGCV